MRKLPGQLSGLKSNNPVLRIFSAETAILFFAEKIMDFGKSFDHFFKTFFDFFVHDQI